MGCRDGENGLDPVVVAALEQRVELVGGSNGFLPFIAFDEQVQKEPDGGAAEAVSDEVALTFSPFSSSSPQFLNMPSKVLPYRG